MKQKNRRKTIIILYTIIVVLTAFGLQTYNDYELLRDSDLFAVGAIGVEA